MSALSGQATGTLESRPFGTLLVEALDARLTGTLVLEEPNGLRHGVYFQAGTPSRARIGARAPHLGEVLVETGALSASACERTLERALVERVLHGQILLNEGLISEEALDQGLSEQLLRQVSWLFGQPLDTKYGYFADKNFLSRWGGPQAPRFTPLELLWRGLRDHARTSEVEAALAAVVGRRVALIDGLPREHFDFMGPECRVIDCLRARPQYVTELIESAPAQESSIKRVVCFLVLTRSMHLGCPSAPPAGLPAAPSATIPPPARVPSFASVSPPSATTRTLTPKPEVRSPSGSVPALSARSATLREEARQRLERIGKGHYEVLGLTPATTALQVQAAFFRLAKRWHPDRLAVEASSLRSSATRIFASLAEANRVLSDPELRRDYDARCAAGASDAQHHDAVAQALAGELAFLKAEAFLERGNLAAARRETLAALGHDPNRAEHLSLQAWLSVLEPNADVGRVALTLSRARRAGAGSPKVHYYAGLVLQHLGRHASALREFRLVLEKEPRHINAARAVRIYERRLASSPKDHPSLAPEPPPSASPASLWRRFIK